jgi:hypothetical protein
MVSEQKREYFEVSERIHLRRNIMERMYLEQKREYFRHKGEDSLMPKYHKKECME